ncbi:YiiX/YebB-like N1pC/P60 family cysteine hydrolase [Candidatus Margulisiibacteriota bacterium]
MFKRLNVTFIVVMLLMLFSCASFAGGGGGKGGSLDSRPLYYSFEDLREALRVEYFYFANINKPLNALVNLGFFPPFTACGSDFTVVSSTILLDPSKYRVDTAYIMGGWDDSVEIPFDVAAWQRFQTESGNRGDLIFTRGNSTANNLVKMFSNWNHVAIVDSISEQKVFESTPSGGVDVNKTNETWGDVTYYTCKKIVTLTYSQVMNALDSAEMVYKGKPYFPTVSTMLERAYFLYRWCDKDDMSSMYCSKLVYHAFKPYISLDSNNTSTFNSNLQEKALGAPMFAWIGVSPDDIYYSDALGPDFCYSPNVSTL